MSEKERTLPGIDVLNTGYGDFELRFDENKPDEVQKAKETITDMLKRGYAIPAQGFKTGLGCPTTVGSMEWQAKPR